MPHRHFRLLAVLCFGGAAGCASGFAQVHPGMTSREVREVMREAPSRAREFPDGSVAWYYGEDRCLRLREDRVVEKQESAEARVLTTPWGSIREVRKAVCAPPGSELQEKEQVLETPWGTFRGTLPPLEPGAAPPPEAPPSPSPSPPPPAPAPEEGASDGG